MLNTDFQSIIMTYKLIIITREWTWRLDLQPIHRIRILQRGLIFLISSDLPEIKWFPTKKRISIPRCNRSACRHCPVLDKTGWVKSTSTGRKYRTQTRISCTSSNVIYLIQCKICNKQYVGQTRNKILTRLNQHYSTIRTKQDTPVSRHFNGHQCVMVRYREDIISSRIERGHTK